MSVTGKTKKITFDELFALAGKSPALKAMPASDLYALLTMAADPDSKAFKNLYKALEKERTLLDRVDANFSKIVNKIQNDFEVGLTEVSVKSARRQLEKEHKQAEKEEEETAAGLLKSL